MYQNEFYFHFLLDASLSINGAETVNAEFQETEQGLSHVCTQKSSLLKGNWARRGGIGHSRRKMEQRSLRTPRRMPFIQPVL